MQQIMDGITFVQVIMLKDVAELMIQLHDFC